MQSIMSTWSARYPTFSIWISSLNFKLLAAAVHSDKFNGPKFEIEDSQLFSNTQPQRNSTKIYTYIKSYYGILCDESSTSLAKRIKWNKLPASQIFHATASNRQKRLGAPNCWCDGRISHHLCWCEGWRPWQTDRFAWSPEFRRVVFGWGFLFMFIVWGKA